MHGRYEGMPALPCSQRQCRRGCHATDCLTQCSLMSSTLLQNEPHTRDLYERNRGWPPGQLVRNWLWEMAAYVKSIDGNHMVGCTTLLCVKARLCSACWAAERPESPSAQPST